MIVLNKSSGGAMHAMVAPLNVMESGKIASNAVFSAAIEAAQLIR